MPDQTHRGNGGLANLVVYISQGLAGDEAISSQPVKIEQKGCQYVPPVVAVNVGQRISVMNDDKTGHNIHPEPKPGGGNVSWNKSQLEGSPALDVVWNHAEMAIPIKCNIHPWMRAYIAVVEGAV
jgi:plastocyanin